MTLSEAAQRVAVTPPTLRRWIHQGLIPQHEGDWTAAAIGEARVVAKMRERSVQQIRKATEEGRLAFGFLDELFGSEPERDALTDAARPTGLDEELITRLIAGLGGNRRGQTASRCFATANYGRDINIARRVSARSAGGEVLVTRPVVEARAGGGHLEFERIGEITLKGFTESTEVFVARQRQVEAG